MPTGLRTPFQQGHDLKYGLKVAERDTDSNGVVSVVCRFCVKFGRETKANAKRKRTTNWQYFKFPFRADHYKRHHESVHPQRWKLYSAATDEDKRSFFDRPNHANTMLAHLDCDEPIQINIRASIVEQIVGDMLFHPDDVEAQASRARALDIFKPDASGVYKVAIRKPRLFSLLVGFVSDGASFRSAAAHARTTHQVTKLSYLGGASDARCASFIRVICAASLNRISELLMSSWAYSLALDVGSVQGTSYLDIRVRFMSVCGSLENLHVLAVPLFENKTAATLFGVCERVMNALDVQWRSRLLSIGTDGEASMTGHLSGVQTLLDRATQYPLIRVWCGLHQLDLVAQAEYKRLGDARFVEDLMTLIRWLRLQQTLRTQMGTTCPRVASTRWLSMSTVTSWLVTHRTRVRSELKKHDRDPGNKWWVLLLSLDKVTKVLSTTCQRLQGLTTLLTQQEAQLREIRTNLAKLVAVSGPLTAERIHQLVPSNKYAVRGAYAVKLADARDFIRDCGQLAIDALTQLESELGPHETDASVISVAEMFAGLVEGIEKIVATRNSQNKPSIAKLPPVLPHQLMRMRTASVCELVKLHEPRLIAAGWTAPRIELIESDHQDLLDLVRGDDVVRRRLEQCTDSKTDFETGWKLIHGLCKTLQQFCGALSTTFPNTASVESDFSVIGWEKDEYRHSLTNFSLEGILHAKQYNRVCALATNQE